MGANTRLFLLPVVALAAVTFGACVPTGDSTPPDGGADQTFTKAHPGCLECHGQIEDIHARVGVTIACTDCHGGDFSTADKSRAHVLPTLPVLMDNIVAPLDDDLPYQQFVSPSNLRIAGQTCGLCHGKFVDDVLKSMMATAAAGLCTGNRRCILFEPALVGGARRETVFRFAVETACCCKGAAARLQRRADFFDRFLFSADAQKRHGVVQVVRQLLRPCLKGFAVKMKRRRIKFHIIFVGLSVFFVNP